LEIDRKHRADIYSTLSDAQTSSLLAPENLLKVAKVLKRRGDPKLFDDVHLPKSFEYVFLTTFLPQLVPDLEIPPASLSALDPSNMSINYEELL